MLETPIMITAPSKMRVVTKPSAKPSCCRLSTEKSATAVPMPARATIVSSKPPTRIAVSPPTLRMKFGSVFTGP